MLKRLVWALIALTGVIAPANAEVWIARYGTAETFNFKLYNADGTLDTDESDGGTEVSLSCNEGNETTATNDFVDEGNFYSIALTASEMQCERIAVVVAATTTEVFFIETFGNASALTPTLATNIGASDFQSGAIDATAIAADAIGASELATDAVGASEIAASAIGASEIADGGITSTEFGTAAITATVIATDAIGSAELADGAIDGATFSCPATAGTMGAQGIIDCGTAQSVSGTTLQLRSAAAFADDEIIGATCLITGGSAGVGQSRTVTDYVSSTDTATVATWTTTPSGTITYICFGTATGSSGSVTIAAGGISASSFASGAIDATAIAADAIGASELATDAIGAAEIAASAIGSSELADGGITSSEFGSGAITATVIAADAIGASELATDAIGDAELAADAVNAIQSGLATSSAQSTLQTSVDDIPTNAELSTALTAQLTSQRIIIGTCDSGSTTTCVDADLTQAAAAQLEDRLICFDDAWCALITTFTPAGDLVVTTKIAPSTRASKAYTIFPTTLE